MGCGCRCLALFCSRPSMSVTFGTLDGRQFVAIKKSCLPRDLQIQAPASTHLAQAPFFSHTRHHVTVHSSNAPITCISGLGFSKRSIPPSIPLPFHFRCTSSQHQGNGLDQLLRNHECHHVTGRSARFLQVLGSWESWVSWYYYDDPDNSDCDRDCNTQTATWR